MGNVAVSLFGFAGFAIMAHSFQPRIFGEWVLFITAAAFVDMFRFGITTTAVVRHLSGAEKHDGYKIMGSFILILIIVSVFLTILIWGAYLAFPGPIQRAGYELFFIWFPVMMFITLPFYTAQVIFQAHMRFDRILLVNGISSAAFFCILLLNSLFFTMTLTHIVLAQLAVYLCTSLLCVIAGWDGLKYLRYAAKDTSKILLDFGKYTTFTLIGTNLLRGADTLIISLSPMGTAAVALYSIPMKLTELQQIPLRSFSATAFPKMSKASIQGKVSEVRDAFYTYSGAMTYLFAFISLLTFIFADFFVLLVGGRQYIMTDPAMEVNAVHIMRIFSIYGLLLPIERMTGIGLDSVNRPDRNFQKVMYMLGANVIGDLIAVFIFQSLIAVAIASVIFTLLGIWMDIIFSTRRSR
jgi:O-antigen/teichoic acid export membrane protein